MSFGAESGKKILIVGQVPPPWGGQAINIQKMVDVLHHHQYNYRLIPMHFSDEINDSGRLHLHKVSRLFRIFFQLLWQLLIYKPDLVYYPPAGPSFIPMYRDMALLLPIRLLGFPVIFHFHAGGITELYPKLNPFLRSLFRKCYFEPDHAICLSARGLSDPEMLNAKKSTLIPSGVEDPGHFGSLAQTGRFIVLFAGLCTEKKGLLDFIEVIRIARKENPLIYGKILGKIYSEKEEQAIKSAEQDGILIYEGEQTGVKKTAHFNTSHAFLFPSYFEAENFPTVILEAFASGLPVIASEWRGIPDQVQHGKNGYICKVHATREMARYLVMLSKDTDLYRSLSFNARADFETKYTMDIFDQSMVSFFKSL